jgi:hypothetical protein
MTAEAFADLLQAHPSGTGKWQARCPAHTDRLPSLSIREGQDGRVLLHCFAGCTHTAILGKLGLARSDLFAGPPPSPAQRAALQAEREAREYVAHKERRQLRAAWDCVRKWKAIVDRLGEKLVRTPDAEAHTLAKLFHEANDRMHEAETEAEAKENEARTKGRAR